jgi:hypothetical protein
MEFTLMIYEMQHQIIEFLQVQIMLTIEFVMELVQ